MVGIVQRGLRGEAGGGVIDTGSLEQELGRYGGQMEARAEAERLLGRYVDISQTPWEFEGTKRISVTASVEGVPMWVYASSVEWDGAWVPMFVFCIGRRSSIEYAQWMSRDDETREPLPPHVTFRRIEVMAEFLPYRDYEMVGNN